MRVADRNIDLGIDTAADHASLALLRGDEVIATRAWHVDTTMSQELLANLDALLVGADVTRDQIASIAVTTGPGQYGAVRTGLATAQGLALALDVPLAGVSRLEAEAALYLDPAAPERVVIAVHEAGRSGTAWAAYTLDDSTNGAPRCLV
ncbi:MAG: tRNA (adenosine(37)-N6)-threonylcarbamoyltransferase complex dimerization subunit type 1 TsaB, partial [Chloroflexi bacterium]